MSPRILLADDHRMIREMLRTLFDGLGMEVVGEAENGREAIRLAKRARPDVVVMDVSMPEMNGIEATRRLTSDCPKVKVIALSVTLDPRFVREMLDAGASGYVVKGGDFEEVVRAVQAALAGRVYLSPVVSEALAARGAPGKPGSSGETLSDREREVLQLLAEGKGSKEIAALLHVSVKTVETHRQHVMKKLRLRTLPELTRYALRVGLTTLDG